MKDVTSCRVKNLSRRHTIESLLAQIVESEGGRRGVGNREAEFCGVKGREEACDPLSPSHSSYSLSPCRRGLLRLVLLARRISTLYKVVIQAKEDVATKPRLSGARVPS